MTNGKGEKKPDMVPAFLVLNKTANTYIEYLLHVVHDNISQCFLSDYYILVLF